MGEGTRGSYDTQKRVFMGICEEQVSYNKTLNFTLSRTSCVCVFVCVCVCEREREFICVYSF
jgi:hypothetical protein